jgi:hypothetical protein
MAEGRREVPEGMALLNLVKGQTAGAAMSPRRATGRGAGARVSLPLPGIPFFGLLNPQSAPKTFKIAKSALQATAKRGESPL